MFKVIKEAHVYLYFKAALFDFISNFMCALKRWFCSVGVLFTAN